jgi:hypothetical protein
MAGICTPDIIVMKLDQALDRHISAHLLLLYARIYYDIYH